MAVRGNFIGGEWLAGREAAANINPSDLADVIGDYAQASQAETEAAVAAARAALPRWREVTIQQRFEILDRIGSEILARQDELGRLLSREEGKTLPEGVGEVVRAGMI
ncbi:MAG: aldehyde dehydrogenase family protein, partial [Desulfuromonadales bacterium]|nr:aldehyde dehydrogenase family protein [Desulfuromonadales bacterium]